MQLDRGIRVFDFDVVGDRRSWIGINPATTEWIGDSANNCFILRDGARIRGNLDMCLWDMDAWRDAHPDHPLLVIFLGEGETMGQRPQLPWQLDDLESHLLSSLGRDRLLVPADLRGAHPSIWDAIQADGWPTVEATRGRVMVVLNDRGETREAYLRDGGDDPADPLMFIVGDPETAGQAGTGDEVVFTFESEGAPLEGIGRERQLHLPDSCLAPDPGWLRDCTSPLRALTRGPSSRADAAKDIIRRMHMTNRIACALTLLACLPAPAAAEGRKGDHLDVTAGHTSLLALPDTDASGLRTAVRIWLHRDHGTLRQTVRGASPGHTVGLYAGVGSARPQPSGFVDGQPPALWSSTAMLEPPHALPASEDVRLWRWRAAAEHYTVAWTVPYAGDTWGMSGHRDCDCGSPVWAGVAHIRLTVRTGDPGPGGMPDGVPLVADNRSGAAVDVFEGQERVAVVPPGGRWRSRTRGEVLTFSFIEGWRPPSAWGPPTAAAERAALRSGALKRTHTSGDVRLDAACEIVGSDGHDPARAPMPGRPLTVRCRTRSRAKGSTTWRTRRVSQVRAADAWHAERLAAEPPGGPYAHRELMRAGFVLDMLREHVAPPAPRALERWPLFAGRASIERAGARWTPIAGAELAVSASSTLPSARGRYAADNVLDGDPTTAWCEGVAGDGMGERLTLRVPGPPRPVLVAVVPGYARGDWHFAANGAPVSLRADDGAVLTPLRLPDSADLYREGQAVEVLGILSSDAVSLVLHGVRPGRRFNDTCLSEVLLFEQR